MRLTLEIVTETTFGFPDTDNSFQGDQVRGFGFAHDGEIDTLFRFHHGISFSDAITGTGNGAYAGNGRFRADRRAVPPIGDAALRLLAGSAP